MILNGKEVAMKISCYQFARLKGNFGILSMSEIDMDHVQYT